MRHSYWYAVVALVRGVVIFGPYESAEEARRFKSDNGVLFECQSGELLSLAVWRAARAAIRTSSTC